MREMIEKKVSVLMGVYNCADTLRLAIESIQHQAYKNWELIICDDGSTDQTYTIAKEAASTDPRIIILKNDRNKGLNITLNRCFAASSGELLARMDGDDESLPERFQMQVDFLNTHPEFAFVSSPMFFFDESGEWGRNSCPEYPTPEQVVTGSPFCHAPVMIRRECLEAVNGYTEDRRMLRVEDVNLWIKLYSKGYRGYNLQHPLYRMRNDQNAFRRRKYKYRLNSTYVRLLGCKEMHLGALSYFKAFKPMLYGLAPTKLRRLYRSLHNRRIER